MTPATLAFDTAHPVHYAIPLWLRDQQIDAAIKRVAGRIQPVAVPRPEPIAIVGFGPSLRDTWEQLRGYPFLMTCSGSHRFLIDRGIIPTWHVEVDPRAHKVGLLGPPHPAVEYLVASTCHPKYFDHLEGAKVTLWHVFDSTAEGKRTLPPGEWAIMGGCDVGLRCLTLASFLGFRDLHVFGIDGSAPGPEAQRHAAEHPHGRTPYAMTEYGGRTWYTTPAMLEAAKMVRHELAQLPKVRATFYGDGLVQAMARDYVPPTEATPHMNTIAAQNPELISVEYARLNAQLHASNPAYGVGGERYAPTVRKLAESMGTKNILDYGCGKGRLGKMIPWQIAEYDPAIPGKEERPKPADLVCCFDVLEHVEPDRLGYVLSDLKRCVAQIGYFVIHTGPSSKSLADGRNAHLLQRPRLWWKTMLKRFFSVNKITESGPLLHVVVSPKPARTEAPA